MRYRVNYARRRVQGDQRTPLIIKPKLNGNRIHLGPADVGIGSRKLPGLCFCSDPSAMRTTRSVKEEMMPMREVMERKRRGTKVVGKMLRDRRKESARAGGAFRSRLT